MTPSSTAQRRFSNVPRVNQYSTYLRRGKKRILCSILPTKATRGCACMLPVWPSHAQRVHTVANHLSAPLVPIWQPPVK